MKSTDIQPPLPLVVVSVYRLALLEAEPPTAIIYSEIILSFPPSAVPDFEVSGLIRFIGIKAF